MWTAVSREAPSKETLSLLLVMQQAFKFPFSQYIVGPTIVHSVHKLTVVYERDLITMKSEL